MLAFRSGLKGSSFVQQPGSLDSTPRFLNDLRQREGGLTPAERQTVLRIHLLAEALDGGIVTDQLQVWERIALVMVSIRAHAIDGVQRQNCCIQTRSFHAIPILSAEREPSRSLTGGMS
jgi:hypothetical protein